MEKSIIIKKAQDMSSVEDLLVLLNELKQEEYGDKAFPIELKKITYYQNPKRSGRYSQFQIPKKMAESVPYQHLPLDLMIFCIS